MFFLSEFGSGRVLLSLCGPGLLPMRRSAFASVCPLASVTGLSVCPQGLGFEAGGEELGEAGFLHKEWGESRASDVDCLCSTCHARLLEIMMVTST